MRPMTKRAGDLFHALSAHLAAVRRKNIDLRPECAKTNLNRILYCTMITIPVEIVLILVFSLHFSSEAGEAQWCDGIAASHTVIGMLMLVFLPAAWKLRKSGSLIGAEVLQLVVAAAFLTAGIVIASIDQLVTTNITPFTLACMMVGAMFLITPVYSALLFTAAFAAFCLAIDRGGNAKILLSNRVNGLAAAAIGFAVSLAMWRHFMVEVGQRRQIETQSAELERVNRELQSMAFTDSLTGLPNRRYFDQALERELGAIRRGGQSACIIEFDLDYFKEINDSYGHVAGDEVLRQIAKLVSGAIRQADMIARYGGEEFILMLPETNLEGARAAAEKLRRQVASQGFCVEGHEIRLTASFGVAELDSEPAADNYHAVDRALYQAKQKGRNRVDILE